MLMPPRLKKKRTGKNRNDAEEGGGGRATRNRNPSSDGGGQQQQLRVPRRPVKGKPGAQCKLCPMQYFLPVLVLIVALGIAAFVYKRNLQYRIVTPLDQPKVVTQQGLDVPDRYWGSYRPAVYFGLKTRSPRSPTMGLMWFAQKVVDNQLPLRYWCELNDFQQRYTWLEHDGTNFGVQKLYDGDVVLTVSFVKRQGGHHGGDWTTRITAEPLDATKKMTALSLLFYVALEGEGHLEPHVRFNTLEAVGGETEATGAFRMSFHNNGTHLLATHYLSTTLPRSGGLEFMRDTVMNSLSYFAHDHDAHNKYIGLIGDKFPPTSNERKPDFLVHQVTVALPFEMEVVYESGSFTDRPNGLSEATYTASLDAFRKRFDEKIEKTFSLRKTSEGHTHHVSEREKAFAKAAISNLIGGIGYFHGRSLVQGPYNEEPLDYFEAPLYTAVPSRPTFPRGFLWDEGFHALLVGRWDPELAKDILGHWMDLMNIDGWIPREQVLDSESKARIPREFLVQRSTNANPPSLFLALEAILDKMDNERSGNDDEGAFLVRMFGRLRVWFGWFNATQIGKLPGSYYWHGRGDRNHEEELNPLTLASGLDDYPRATNPTDDERHVDLRCWMAFAAGVMARIAHRINESAWEKTFADTAAYLSNNRLLDELHWSTTLQAYADYGLHSNKVRLEKKPRPSPGPSHQHHQPPPPSNPVRVYDEVPSLQFVDAFGYVSLFPFLMKILEPSSDKLAKILEDVANRKLLWTDFGLRSLAASCPYYAKPNTPDSPPYWRGAIWINVNYMAVKALRYYASVEGPSRRKAEQLHTQLRENLVRNVLKEYEATGFVWEQYDDRTGKGRRAHPFTGWSALIVLIMAPD